MNTTFGKSKANDTGDWQNNKEMNPAANSSATEDGVLNENDQESAGSWRDAGNEGKSGSGAAAERSPYRDDTGDPGRTPGKAEGTEDFQEKGNE